MYAYAKKYQTSEVWLLYPMNPDIRNHHDISFLSADNVNVRVYCVDVANIENSFHNLRTKLLTKREYTV